VKIKTAASLMCADLKNLAQDVKKLEKGGIDWLHFDIMDGHFVLNLTLGLPILKSLRDKTSLPFDVHLQVNNPEKLIPIFAKIGADIITFHAEATHHLYRMIQVIKEKGKKASLALCPATPLNHIEYILPQVDMVVLMTVESGFAGQNFISEMIPKIRHLKEMIDERGLEIDIQVDGNIDEVTIPQTKKAGANIFVAGTSSIFSGKRDLEEATRQFKKICEQS